jgi:cleavage stimulation factor subunit 2
MDTDKSMRSVFVGNIPYEATEEKLKEVFSEVGVVNSFKLVYDRENGKPKGYGFCEFKDAETALSAMRNLNGYEIGGRTLRVDNACTEKNKMDQMIEGARGGGGGGMPPAASAGGGAAADRMAPMMGPAGMGMSEGPYGEPVEPEKAPESISKAVASLPPEQMFELMKQMKACITNNPQEARMMLNQNPQLAYALLQAQVVMRSVVGFS